MSKTNWIEIKNASDKSADVYIYGDIGEGGVTAADFIASLRGLRVSTINVHISSSGGSVFEGLAVYNALNAHPATIVVHVDGIAASIASVIAMAGDEIVMAENAMMMIHRPSIQPGYAGSDELRQKADVIDKIESGLVSIYSTRTGIDSAEIRNMLAVERWFTAAEALAKGFATRIEKSKGATAAFDVSKFRNGAAALARSAAPVAAIDCANMVRSEFAERLTAKNSEIATLTAKLAFAESMSAFNLGVPPIGNTVSSNYNPTGSGDVLSHYRALTGSARADYFAKNKESIWAAYEAEGNK